jgi:hypothetical protein
MRARAGAKSLFKQCDYFQKDKIKTPCRITTYIQQGLLLLLLLSFLFYHQVHLFYDPSLDPSL